MSQESKTPMTDAEQFEAYGSSLRCEVVPASFARQLERELAAVTAERDALIASARIKEVNAKWDVAKLEFVIKAHESGIAAHSPTTEPER